jgi:uncharacterized phage-associated protein
VGAAMPESTANEENLKAAIAHIASKRPVGKVKLFKLLYLADFTAYVELGESITGDSYENFEMGPVPVTLWHNFDRIARDCVEITFVETGLPKPEQEMRARTDREFRGLSPAQKALLDGIIEQYGHLSGAELRKLTHGEIPYRATNRREIIPYYLAAYRAVRKPTNSDILRVTDDMELMAELRSKLARLRGS